MWADLPSNPRIAGNVATWFGASRLHRRTFVFPTRPAAPLPPSTPGRIWLAGQTLMSGYFRRPPPVGPFFDTGDLGYLDDAGALHVLSRRSDPIVTGGENVYPAEVEAALLTCPGVAAALVFGVADPLWGARVVAALVPTAAELAPTWRWPRHSGLASFQAHAAVVQRVVSAPASQRQTRPPQRCRPARRSTAASSLMPFVLHQGSSRFCRKPFHPAGLGV